jgi:predicted  nucleic acid-binding Zn-ribbon protein
MNHMLASQLESTESAIREVGARNSRVAREFEELDQRQEELEGRVRRGMKLNKELRESIMAKKEEIAGLNNQKEYYSKLIEGELQIKEDL